MSYKNYVLAYSFALDQNEIEFDDDDVNDEETSPKNKRPASIASNPCSKRTKSYEGTTRLQSSTSSVQKKVSFRLASILIRTKMRISSIL